ncbi:unnamed protein product [Tilletia controversa]|nr:unnamed protein product [Tilletia controversa]CAD6912699.1 unnamed protein product [Tilletia caries]
MDKVDEPGMGCGGDARRSCLLMGPLDTGIDTVGDEEETPDEHGALPDPTLAKLLRSGNDESDPDEEPDNELNSDHVVKESSESESAEATEAGGETRRRLYGLMYARKGRT